MLRRLPIYSRFIAGTTIGDVQRVTAEMKPWKPIVDYALEHAPHRQHETFDILTRAINRMPGASFALKLSAFESGAAGMGLVRRLCHQARLSNSTILIDAEQVRIQDRIDDNTDDLIREFNTHRPVVYKTYQMYRKDRLEILNNDLNTFKHLGVKLVRGAYHNEDKHTGLLYTNIYQTHRNFNDGLQLLNDYNHTDCIIATHNFESCVLLNSLDFKPAVAQLYGMGDHISYTMGDLGLNVYKYVPFGPVKETVPYLLRRLHENMGMLYHV